MKRVILFIFICSLVGMAYGSNQRTVHSASTPVTTSGGVKFAPQKRVSSLTNEERERAIAQKRSEMGVDVATLVSPRSLRMTILPPAIQGDITENICEQIIMQMLCIASSNGIAGINGSSPIAFAASLHPAERYVTGSAPQRMIVKYNVTYYVLNMQTWDVYATTSSTIQGAGESFEQATSNAVFEIKNTPALQQMLAQSEKQIISWFENNIQHLTSQVNQACGRNDYAAALAILNSVPEQATKCYAWVSTRINGVSNSFKKQLAHKELSALKNAITAARAEYSPEVAAHLAMLPAGSPEAAEGARLYNAYMKQVDTERLRQISAEERRRQEELEMQKLQMQYEAEATAKAAQASNQTNSGGKLRSFFAGASVFSMISNVLARCLFII
jgi:hypothetical protein